MLELIKLDQKETALITNINRISPT